MPKAAILRGLLLVLGLSDYCVLMAVEPDSRAAAGVPARESHLLLNGDFETVSAVHPNLPEWWMWSSRPGSKAEGSLDSTVVHGGKFAFRLRNLEPVPGTFAWLTQFLPTLEPNTDYQVSFWAKAEGNAGGSVAIATWDGRDKSGYEFTPFGEPTFDWRKYTQKFNSGEDVEWTVRICADGKVKNLWVDDMVVTKLMPTSAASPRAVMPSRSASRRSGDTVHVKDFGAMGDRVTDDTAAIQSALNSLGRQGGTVLLGNGRYRVGTVIIPENVGLQGDLPWPEEQADVAKPQQCDYSEVGSQLCLKAGCSVVMRHCSALQNCLLIRDGLPLPATNDDECTKLVNAFSGKGVIATESGILIHNCMLLGFDTAIAAAGRSGGGSGRKGRIIIDHCRIDAINGINISDSSDIVHIDYVHCWVFLTTYVPGVTGKNVHRKGTGIRIGRNNDWLQVTNSFCYGYKIDFACEDTSAVSFLHCGADHDAPDDKDSIGFAITGSCELIAMLGCTVVTPHTGVLVDASGRTVPTKGFSNNVRIEGCTFVNLGASIDIRKGSIVAIGNTFNGSGVGIKAGPNADPAILMGNCFDTCSTPLALDKKIQARSSVLGNNFLRCKSAVGAIFNVPVVYPTYALAELPSAADAGPGATIFVSDAPGGAALAVSDGTNWRLLTGTAIVPKK